MPALKILSQFKKHFYSVLILSVVIAICLSGILYFQSAKEAAKADGIATALTNVTDTPTNTQISASTSHKIDFTTYTTVPADGKIKITFPDGFDVSKVASPVANKQWNGATWGSVGACESDIAFAKLEAQPASGAVFSALYEDDTSGTDDLLEMRLIDGGAVWSAQSSVWSGHVARNLGLTKVDMASRKDSGSTTAMMTYDTQTVSTIPKYKLWDGSAWGSEANANAVNGEIRHQLIKYAPTRNEAILVTLGSTGEVHAQVWNGTTWGTAATLGTMADANGSKDIQSLYRGFDLEYETLSGDAIVVYGDGTADPDYKVWNGTSWSDGVNIDIPTTGMVNWIELASSPIDDSIALITLDNNVDVYGLRWTGSAWDNMGATAVWDATASIATKKAIDVAFEKTTGDIMFIWGDSVSTDQYYRTYSGTTLSAATLLDNSQAGGVDHWVKLASDPSAGSNKIMFGVLDAGSDLNTFEWSGTAWSAVHTEHSASTEDIVDMNFDIVYETHPSNAGKAWLVWGDGATVSSKLWDGVSAWGAAATRGDDTAFVALEAQPASGAIFGALYEDDTSGTDDLLEMRLIDGGAVWSAQSSVWTGPVTRNLGLTKISMASRRDSGSTYALMIYDTQTVSTIPKYKLWDGSAWGSEAQANAVNGEIRHQLLKYAPTRNEAILVALGSTGEVQAQVWNGTAWGTATTLGTMADANGSRDIQSLYRGFDLEYETLSGDAIVVYGDGTADPDYKVWNGTSWSDGVNIDIPTTGMVNWIELAASPIDDSIALITLDNNVDVYGLRWTGSAWDNMGATAVWDATASIATKKAIDVAFEKTTGDIMFIWGDATSTDQYYRAYSGTTLSSATLLDNPNAGGVDHWIKLASDPSAGSNKIMFGVLDAGSDLNTFEWSGTAWGAVHTEHSGTTEDIVDMNFDIVYETHPSNAGKAWLVWGDGSIVKSSWSGFDGSKTISVDGQTVTIIRDGTGTATTSGAKYITLVGVINNSSPGTNYTVTVETQNASSATLSGPTTSYYFSLCTNSCHTTTYQLPWNANESVSTKHTTKFTTASTIPADGKIKITFPTGFNVVNASTTTSLWSGFDGGLSLSVNEQTATIARDGTGTAATAGAKYIVLDNITNHSTAGSNYYAILETTNGSDTNLQGPTAIRISIKSLQPWTLAVAADNSFYQPGSAITYTATTSLPAADPATLEANKIQAYPNAGYSSSYALKFDGSDDYVKNGNPNTGLSGDFEGTLMAWIKPSEVDQSVQMVAGMMSTYSSSYTHAALFISVSGTGGVGFHTSMCGQNTANNLISNSNWYHIAATKTPGSISTTTKIYVNGVEYPTTNQYADCTPNLTVQKIEIGAGWWTGDSSYPFNGLIDDVRIWNVALNEADIFAHYNSPTSTSCANTSGCSSANLVGHWKMDEGTGQTVADSSGNGNNGTLGTNTNDEVSDPVWSAITVPYIKTNISALTYYSLDGSGNYIWTGNYTIPAGTAEDAYTTIIESASPNIETDFNTYFTLPPVYSYNTGLNTTVVYTVDSTAPVNFTP